MHDYPKLLKRAADCHSRGEAFAMVTVIRTLSPTSTKVGDKALVTADGMIHGWIGGGCAQPAVISTVRRSIADGQPRHIRITPEKSGQQVIEDIVEFGMPCHSGGTIELFVNPVAPQQELVVLGDSPVADALLRIAPNVGFRVTWLADADAAEGDVRIVSPARNEAIRPGAYVVVATQGRQDLPLLQLALGLNARHVAFVASRRKAQVLKETLIEAGIDRRMVDAIEAPAGAPIDAQTPEEIALSIVYSLVAKRRDGTGAVRSAERTAPVPTVAAEPQAVMPAASCCGGKAAAAAVAPAPAAGKHSCCSE